MDKKLDWTAGFKGAVVQISGLLQAASSGVNTGANASPSNSQNNCTLSSFVGDTNCRAERSIRGQGCCFGNMDGFKDGAGGASRSSAEANASPTASSQAATAGG